MLRERVSVYLIQSNLANSGTQEKGLFTVKKQQQQKPSVQDIMSTLVKAQFPRKQTFVKDC